MNSLPLPLPQPSSTFWAWPGGVTLEAPAACGAALAAALGMHPAPSRAADVRLCRTADRPPPSRRAAGGFEVAPDGDDVWIARRGLLRVTGVRAALLDPATPVQLDFAGAMPSPALVRPWLHWRALERGLAPVHATASAWRGAGVLAAGESGAGKTAILLTALALGAQLVASEWPLVAAEPGATVYADGEPLRIRAWHLRAVPEIAAQLVPERVAAGTPPQLAPGPVAAGTPPQLVPERVAAGTPPQLAPGQVRKLATPVTLIGLTAAEQRRLQRHARWAAVAGSLPGLGDLGKRLGRRAFTDVTPERIASRTGSCTLQQVLLVRAGGGPGAGSQAVPAAEAALRLAEWARHDDAVLHVAAAACGITAPRLEGLFERRRALLTQALSRADCRMVEVPRRDLAAALAQWIEAI